MVDNQIFNLEKIKEITSPIGELQGKLYSLKELYEFFNENRNRLNQDFTEVKFNEIHTINNIITDIYGDLVKKTVINIHSFLLFQDHLIRKYKESFKNDLSSLELSQSDIVYEIGLFLIKNKHISRVIEKIPIVLTLNSNHWTSLFNSLKYNSIFLSSLQKSIKFLEAQKSKLIEKTIKEKEEIENSKQLIEKQASPELDKYQEYLKYSKEEFRRRRRRERRESLETLEEKPEIQVIKDISEKIEQFKSKLGTDFNEKYLIQKDDQQDPITLIRKLKKEREEKYQKYLKKIKNEKRV